MIKLTLYQKIKADPRARKIFCNYCLKLKQQHLKFNFLFSSNSTSVPIKRITRSKYRRPVKEMDSVYTSKKSDRSRKSESKGRESLELIKENSEASVSSSQANASENQTKASNASKNLSNASKNQSVVSNNLSNTIKSSQSIK